MGGMQVVVHRVPESTLDEFAQKHGLVIVVTERRMDRWQREHGLCRYVAMFQGAEVASGGLLRGEYGEGNTEEEAIRNYAEVISHERLIVGAFTDARREIDVPRLRE